MPADLAVSGNEAPSAAPAASTLATMALSRTSSGNPPTAFRGITGPSATSTRTGQSRESVFDGWTAETPVGRLGRPDELAAVIAFLCSARAGFMTGQAVLVDGGAVRSLL